MATLLGSLLIKLGLDSSDFRKGLTKAERDTKVAGDRMEALGHKIGRTTKILAGLGAAFAGSQFVTIVRDMAMAGLEHASALGEQAQQLGVTTSELQRYRYMASQVGIDQEVMDKGLAKLSVTLGDLSNGAKGPTAALERLGLTQAQIAQVAKMSAGEAIPYLSDAFAKLTSPTEAAAIAADLFGAKMGGKFLTLLMGGRTQIDELTAAYQRLGLELTSGEIAKADQAMDDYAAMQQVFAARQAKVATENAEAVLRGQEAWETFKSRSVMAFGAVTEAIVSFDSQSAKFSARLAEIDRALGIPSPGEFASSIKRNFAESYDRVTGFFSGIYDFTVKAPGWIANMVSQIGAQITGRLNTIWDNAKARIEDVKQRFFNLYDAVVGHSYIPDMVDGIATQMKRLDGEMVKPVQKSTAAAKAAFEKLADEVQPLLDRLFPEAKALNDYRDDLGTIGKAEKAGMLTAEQAEEARRRLAFGDDAGPSVNADYMARGSDPLVEVERVGVAMDKFGRLVEERGKKVEVVNVRVVESFKDMADATLSAIDRMVGAFKNGSFLDKLSAIIGMATQLGKLGAFGKTIQGNLNRPLPKYADGTKFHPGGLAIVGERGRELVNLPRGSSVMSNRDLRGLGGGTNIEVRPSPLFDVVVDGRVRRAAPATAAAGAQMAATGMARSNRWRLA